MTQDGNPARNPEAARWDRTRVLCLVLGAGPLLLSGFMLHQYLSIEDRGRLSRTDCLLLTGKVVNKGRGLEKRGGMQFSVHLVRYAFTFEGRRLEGHSRVSREWHNWLERGGDVAVYVDSSRPQRNFLKLEYDFRVGRVLRRACLAAAAGLVLIVLAIFPRALPMAIMRSRRRAR